MTAYRIAVIDGPESGREVPIGEVVSIGRQADNDLALADPAVSRKHARIIRRSVGLMIEDLGSAHGTSVNGERIKSRELKPGDIIGIGPVSLRVMSDEEDARTDSTDVVMVQSTQAHSQVSMPPSRKSPHKDPSAQATRLEALLQLGLTLQGEREIGKLLQKIARIILDTLDADRCAIFLRGNTKPELVFSRAGIETADSLPFSRTLLSRAMESGEALVTADAGRDQRLAGASLAAGTIRSAMVAPLWGRERVVGAAVVENRGRAGAFDAADLRLLIVLANLAGTAVENTRLIEEVRRETEERASLSRFFSPTVSDEVRRGGLAQGLRGERRLLTVLFTDIRGFTALAETLPPDELLECLNRAFAANIQAIFRENGTIDKFTGDGVLAFFGAPIAQEDHAARAIKAARDILQSCRGLQTRSGRPIRFGIGIATGEATVGTIGSAMRMEYTVIGDVVNVAARLVGIAGPEEILVTAETARAAGVLESAERVGEKSVKGRAGEVQIYRIR